MGRDEVRIFEVNADVCVCSGAELGTDVGLLGLKEAPDGGKVTLGGTLVVLTVEARLLDTFKIEVEVPILEEGTTDEDVFEIAGIGVFIDNRDKVDRLEVNKVV